MRTPEDHFPDTTKEHDELKPTAFERALNLIRERPGWAFLKGKVPITPEERDLIFAHIDALEADNLERHRQSGELRRKNILLEAENARLREVLNGALSQTSATVIHEDIHAALESEGEG